MPLSAPTPLEFQLHDAVRLVERVGNVPTGALGRVLGRFARTNPTYVVSFAEHGVLELRAAEILAVSA
jgi:hypothetical protein